MTAQAFNVQYNKAHVHNLRILLCLLGSMKQPVASKITSLPPVVSTNVPVLVKQV